MQRSRSKSPNTRKSLVLSTVGTCLLFPFYWSNVCYFASFWPSILKPGCIPNLDMLICMHGQHYRCLLPVTSRPIYRDASWDEGYCKLWLVIYFFLGDDFCQKSQKKNPAKRLLAYNCSDEARTEPLLNLFPHLRMQDT